MKLYDHQKEFLARDINKILMCWDTGTGKTYTSLNWQAKFDSQALIIVPKALKENWKRASEEVSSARIPYIITKEEFRRDWDDLPRFNTIIVDEAHYFSGIKSQMSHALYNYITRHNVQNVLLLTATPYLSTPWNIYTLAKMLGYNWNYIGFKNKFFVDRYIGRKAVPQVKPGIENDIAELVRQIGHVVKLEDCVDVPEQVFETKFINETEEQKKGKKNVQEANAIVRYTKHHEIENGVLKSDGYEPDQFFEENKLSEIRQLIEGNKKVAIVCRYNLQIDKYKNELASSGTPVFVIRGDVKDRDAVVREADAADKAIILIQANCSEGYELPSFGVVVFASLSYSYKDYKQMLGRFLRINRLKKNVFVHMVIPDAVDEAVFKAIMNKQDFDMSIYARETAHYVGK